MQAEHFKIRLELERADEQPDPSRWRISLEMVQLAFETG